MVKDTVDCDIRVRYAETDQWGRLLRELPCGFEVGRSEFCRKKDFSYAELEKLGYKLVVTEALSLPHAARYDETITVRTKLNISIKGSLPLATRSSEKEMKNFLRRETRHLCLDRSGKPKSLPQSSWPV